MAVVDAGSFVGAGKALGLSQSGVSRAIQRCPGSDKALQALVGAAIVASGQIDNS
jgi:hypothetical protein